MESYVFRALMGAYKNGKVRTQLLCISLDTCLRTGKTMNMKSIIIGAGITKLTIFKTA